MNTDVTIKTAVFEVCATFALSFNYFSYAILLTYGESHGLKNIFLKIRYM